MGTTTESPSLFGRLEETRSKSFDSAIEKNKKRDLTEISEELSLLTSRIDSSLETCGALIECFKHGGSINSKKGVESMEDSVEPSTLVSLEITVSNLGRLVRIVDEHAQILSDLLGVK